MPSAKEILVFAIARNYDSPPVRFMSKLARAFVKGCENFSFNFNLNGERKVLEKLASAFPEKIVFFDVGANVGDWTGMALAIVPSAEVHCFEIAPPTAKKLREKHSANPRVVVNDFGLFHEDAELDLNFGETHSAHTSVFAPTVVGDFRKIKGKVIKGDRYCTERQLGQIGFLKMDVEGSEHLVLQGLGEVLSAGKIDVIQFEYGSPNMVSHFLLRDFYDFLESRGFVVGKIYPHKVDFRPFQALRENFIGPYYLAVRKARQDLVQLLS